MVHQQQWALNLQVTAKVVLVVLVVLLSIIKDIIMNEIVKAIKAIRPGKKFSFTKDESGNQVLDIPYLDWLDNDPKTKPTPTEISEEVDRQKNELYKESRAAEYPSIGDQLDALWKGGAQAEAMLAIIQSVKNKYPKP
jgi:hypothetical protein